MKNYNKTINKLERNYDEKSVRRLKELEKDFKNTGKLKEILGKENKVIYETFTENFSPLKLTLTVLNSGNIDGEFYFTKGHVHKMKSPEFYILVEGKGSVLVQKDNKINELKMKTGMITLIPQGYAHRLINTGERKLKVLTIYHEDAKPNYNVKFKKRFFKK